MVITTSEVKIQLELTERELDVLIVALANNKERYEEKGVTCPDVDTTIMGIGKLRLNRKTQDGMLALFTSFRRRLSETKL